MASKHRLRSQRTGTIINATASQQETALVKALKRTAGHLDRKFRRTEFQHVKLWYIVDIVRELRDLYPTVDSTTTSTQRRSNRTEACCV